MGLASGKTVGGVMLGVVLLGTVCLAKDTVVLEARRAELSGEGIRKDKHRLSHWKKGGWARWRFELKEAIAGQNVLLVYAAPQDREIGLSVPGSVEKTVKLRSTGDWTDFHTAKIAELTLPAGKHELTLSYAGEGYGLDVRRVRITPDKPPRWWAGGYPPIYKRGASWAESMVAMRAACRTPEISALEGGNLYLNPRDGKALWNDFPRESDWFLQDNQVHGEWGAGVYDARKDYHHYLRADRDSQLEQKLIGHVLDELGAPGADLRKELDGLIAANCSPDDPAWLTLYTKACLRRRRQRLAPLLAHTRKIIYATHMNMGTIYLATETQGCPDGSELRILDLASDKDELLFDSTNGIVRDPELSFDGKKLLFAWRKTNQGFNTTGKLAPPTGNYKIYEMDLASRGMRALTTDATYGADFEPCYLPSGDIMFSSARCVHEVTCGFGDCSNLYIMDGDGRYARRVGFDQTQTAFPHLLDDGRVIFTRRDYNDRGQSYGHALFVMNPDGTSQVEYYGNNTHFPTSIQHTRQVPGTSKTMGIAGGYHSSQGGKLVVVEPSKGLQNYDGLTFINWDPPDPTRLIGENHSRRGEQYSYPYPLDEDGFLVSFSPIGAYLTSRIGVLDKRREQVHMRYKVYYMRLDGRRELLAAHPTLSCTQAIPVAPRPRPPVRASTVDYRKSHGVCYVQDVYYGPSAKGIERGAIKKLRVIKLHYKPISIGAGGWGPPRDQIGPGKRYSSYGWHSVLPTGVGSASFEAKEIIGDAEVHADGSAMFEVPAKAPVYFQLIDTNGLAVQTMRSWATLMPNERFSCVGCHERKGDTPLSGSRKTMAMRRAPQKLKLPANVASGSFSYARNVQPILNRHCVGCHAPGKKVAKIDLSDTIVEDGRNHKELRWTRRKFHQSYLTLLQVGRRSDGGLDQGRPNEWVDYFTRLATVDLTPPYYAGSTKSGLVKMLLQGHSGTKLSSGEIGVVAAWIDLNVPFVGEYDEMNVWDEDAMARYREKVAMREEQERIERENIERYVEREGSRR